MIIAEVMATLTVSEMLTEARAAFHDLQIGKAVARARDSDGSEIQYTQADRNTLSSYIASLERQLANPDAGAASISGPMTVSF